MTDRELIAAAGKAAGIDLVPYTWNKGTGWDHEGFTVACEGENEWNPLESDGTALRLAVDLRLNIEFGNDGADYTVAWDGCIGSGKFYHHESDARNATRWAIVTVAAMVEAPAVGAA